MKNNTLIYRVEQLEKQCEKIDINLDKLMTNDLPHLSEKLISLETKINTWAAINVGAIIVSIIITKMFL